MNKLFEVIFEHSFDWKLFKVNTLIDSEFRIQLAILIVSTLESSDKS